MGGTTIERAIPLLLAAALLAACGGHDDHDEGPEGAHGHAPRYGDDGVMLELGEHEGWVELQHDAGAGTLTAYLWDAHAESRRYSTMPQLRIIARVGRERIVLDLQPVEPALSAPRKGASRFRIQHARLRDVEHLEGQVVAVEVGGRRYEEGLDFAFGEAHEGHDGGS